MGFRGVKGIVNVCQVTEKENVPQDQACAEYRGVIGVRQTPVHIKTGDGEYGNGNCSVPTSVPQTPNHMAEVRETL